MERECVFLCLFRGHYSPLVPANCPEARGSELEPEARTRSTLIALSLRRHTYALALQIRRKKKITGGSDFQSDREFSSRISMADHTGEQQKESTEASLMDKITEKFHDHDSSSSSSDDDSHQEKSSSTTKIYRLFGREKPVHKVLGGGKPADVFLWRDKKISGGMLGVATAVWVLFELVEYHLLTLVCHVLIFALAILFLWSNASTFIKKSPPQIPEVEIPDDIVMGIASTLTTEINRALSVLRDITSGRDLKKFLAVIAGLWVLSCVGSWCNFLTLFYISFVLLHTVPVLYEKYEDHIDPLAEKASAEFKKQYAVFDAKVLSKIPRGPLKDKKVA